MKLTFSRPAPVFLRDSGELVNAVGAPAGARGPIALSRALCRLHTFRAVEGMSAAQVAQAARMAAEANKPFEEADWLILRAPQGAVIWYWDKARLPKALAHAHARLAPESVSFAPGDGWRQVRTIDGCEAQYWEGALLASTWRRQPFTPEQWRLFVQSVAAPTHAAPETPPPPSSAQFDAAGRWRAALIRRPLGWADLEAAAATALLCAFALAAFFAGSALHQDWRARQDRDAAAATAAALSADPQAVRSEAHLRVIADYRETMAAADIFGPLASTLEALNGFGATPAEWSADQQRLRIRLMQTPQDVNVRDLVAALEALPELEAVEPQFAGLHEPLTLEAALVERAAP